MVSLNLIPTAKNEAKNQKCLSRNLLDTVPLVINAACTKGLATNYYVSKELVFS